MSGAARLGVDAVIPRFEMDAVQAVAWDDCFWPSDDEIEHGITMQRGNVVIGADWPDVRDTLVIVRTGGAFP